MVLLGTIEVLQRFSRTPFRFWPRFSRVPFRFDQGFLEYHLGLTKVF